jgi:hypothetical protein
MALFKGTISGAISGKLGGQVFARNAAGAYLRRFSVPTNPNTTRQNEQRAALGNAAVQFRDALTDSQREQWQAFANSVEQVNRLGSKVALTGQQAYVQAVTFPGQIGQPPPPTVPPPLGKTRLGTIVITNFAPTGITLSIQGSPPWAADDLGQLAVYVSPPLSCARQRYRGPWTLAGIVAGNTAAPITTATVTYAMLAGECRFVQVQAFYELRISQRKTFGVLEVQ